jgi:hypothetical protein
MKTSKELAQTIIMYQRTLDMTNVANIEYIDKLFEEYERSLKTDTKQYDKLLNNKI